MNETKELDELLAGLLVEELSVDLTREEQAILHLRYFLGRTVAEIAGLLDTTPGRVSHVGRKANEKVRLALYERPVD